MKILIIGPYPPPWGGISVYVKRFAHLLKTEGYRVDIFDYSKIHRLERYIKLLSIPFGGYRKIYLNCISLPIAIFFLLFKLHSKTVFAGHGNSVESWGRLRKLFFSIFLHKCREIKLVGPHLIEMYRAKGVRIDSRVKVQNVFLPPNEDEESDIISSYPRDILEFVEQSFPLMIANAYQLTFYEGKDLYGLDMCVELTSRLKPEFPDIGFLFVLGDIGDSRYYETIQERINELNIKSNFKFLTGQRELWPLFKKTDLFIRPTYHDGYGISIPEALHFGCPAIASDVCERADGTALFKNRDLEDLTEKCLDKLRRNIKSKKITINANQAY